MSHFIQKLLLSANMTLDHISNNIPSSDSSSLPRTKSTFAAMLNTLLEPDHIVERINDIPMNASLAYSLTRAHLEKLIKTKKNIEDFSSLRLLWLKCQSLIYFLQNYKHLEPIPWRVMQLIGDIITYLPFPYSYYQKEDLISHREISQKDISEIMMLCSSIGSNVLNYFLLTGNRKTAGMLMVCNKTTFRAAQVLKTRKLMRGNLCSLSGTYSMLMYFSTS